MRLRHAVLSPVLLVLLASFAGVQAQDSIVVENPSDATGFVTVKFKLTKGDDVQWEISPKPTRRLVYTEGDYSVLVLNGPEGTKYTVTADWINWDAKKRGRPSHEFQIGKLPKPPPDTDPVPPPKPKPDPDTEPVTSFRAFVIYKKNDATGISVVDGAALQAALDTAVGGVGVTDPNFGWRKIEIDTNGATLPEGLRQVWVDAQKSVLKENSKLPAIAFQVNDTITIETLPATGKEAAELVKKYRRK